MASLKEALSSVYSPIYGRTLNVDTEISVHSGAQEGMLSCIMAFIQPGDEVILLEPVFEMWADSKACQTQSTDNSVAGMSGKSRLQGERLATYLYTHLQIMNQKQCLGISGHLI